VGARGKPHRTVDDEGAAASTQRRPRRRTTTTIHATTTPQISVGVTRWSESSALPQWVGPQRSDGPARRACFGVRSLVVGQARYDPHPHAHDTPRIETRYDGRKSMISALDLQLVRCWRGCATLSCPPVLPVDRSAAAGVSSDPVRQFEVVESPDRSFDQPRLHADRG